MRCRALLPAMDFPHPLTQGPHRYDPKFPPIRIAVVRKQNLLHFRGRNLHDGLRGLASIRWLNLGNVCDGLGKDTLSMHIVELPIYSGAIYHRAYCVSHV